MIIRPPPKLTNRDSTIKYIEIDLWVWLKELANGLFKVNFTENFQSFTVTNLTIPAGTEMPIQNGFRNSSPGVVPSGRIITRQTGNAVIVDGTTQWNANQVYLSNPSANSATITVVFFK